MSATSSHASALPNDRTSPAAPVAAATAAMRNRAALPASYQLW